MNITNNREERKLQKERLKGIYSDYSPIYHDVFVIRFNQEKERESEQKEFPFVNETPETKVFEFVVEKGKPNSF